jgi:hypothetical protein
MQVLHCIMEELQLSRLLTCHGKAQYRKPRKGDTIPLMNTSRTHVHVHPRFRLPIWQARPCETAQMRPKWRLEATSVITQPSGSQWRSNRSWVAAVVFRQCNTHSLPLNKLDSGCTRDLDCFRSLRPPHDLQATWDLVRRHRQPQTSSKLRNPGTP